MTEPRIQPTCFGDLEALDLAFGDRHFLQDRLDRQEKNLGVLLTAWLGVRPVGVVYLWLEEAEEPELAGHLPGVPVLNHLEVVADQRNKGIGSRLLTRAEQILVERNHDQVALAVRTDNDDAARLYRRLGYEHWDHDEKVIVCYAETALPDGQILREEEKCYVFVKKFKPAPQPWVATANASAPY